MLGKLFIYFRLIVETMSPMPAMYRGNKIGSEP